MATKVQRGTSSNLIEDKKLVVSEQLAVPVKDVFTDDEIGSIALGNQNRLKFKGSDNVVREVAGLVDLSSKQDALVSGTNIKTVNGVSILGSGNIPISGGGGDVTTTGTQTLTNKTLTSPVINSPTGLVKADVGLGNVDNTSDASKPVSTAQATALAGKEPTIATGVAGQYWAFNKTWADFAASVRNAVITGFVSGAGTVSPTDTVLQAINKLNGNDALKANLASPAFTGVPTAPTAAGGTSTLQLATTAFVTTANNLKANLASPALTGTPTAPTAANGTNTTQLATTAFVLANGGGASAASTVFNGVGDAVYVTSGDPAQLASGTYNDTALTTVLAAFTDAPFSRTGGGALTVKKGNYRFKSKTAGYAVQTHNTFLRGEGFGNTILHFERDASTNEKALTFGKLTGDLETRLLKAGGAENLTLYTNNANVLNTALVIDYGEFMTFKSLRIERYYKSAILAGIWESNFYDVTIVGCGAGLADGLVGRIAEQGVVDLDSHTALSFRDACNNTNFSGLNFSSCYGTLIRIVAYANTTVNINFYGLNGESNMQDAGAVNELSVFYFDKMSNINVSGGFYTINNCGVTRNAYMLEIGNSTLNGSVSFTNFSFTQNSTSGGYNRNSHQRLNAFIYLTGKNSQLHLDNCTINDPSGSVGFTSGSYLIEGGANTRLTFTNLVFHVKAGDRTITNLFNPAIQLEGNLRIIFYNNSGKTGVEETYVFGKAASTTNAGLVKKAEPQPNSTATTIAQLKDDYNALLLKLSNAGIISIGSGSTLGPELVADPNFTSSASWSLGTGWSIAGGKASHSGADGTLGCSVATTVGKTYRIEYIIDTMTAGDSQFTFSSTNDAPHNTAGTYTFDVVATSTSFCGIYAAGATMSLTKISVKEVL